MGSGHFTGTGSFARAEHTSTANEAGNVPATHDHSAERETGLGIEIIGTGRYLPGRPVTNDEIYARAEDFDVRRAGCSLDDWAVSRIGVRTRHRAAAGEGTSAMAA